MLVVNWRTSTRSDSKTIDEFGRTKSRVRIVEVVLVKFRLSRTDTNLLYGWLISRAVIGQFRVRK